MKIDKCKTACLQFIFNFSEFLLRGIVGILFISSIAGCGLLLASYEEMPVQDVTVLSSNNPFGRYVLLINYHVTRRGGNVHDMNDLSKTSEIRSELLFINSIQGKVGASEIRYKLFPKDSINRNIQGYIEFNNSSVSINLQVPIYKDGKVTGEWVDWRHNGTYNLNLATNRVVN